MKYEGYADVVELHSGNIIISTCGDAVYDENGLIPYLTNKADSEDWAQGQRFMMDVKSIYVEVLGDLLFMRIEGETQEEDQEKHWWTKVITYKGNYSISWVRERKK
jgi:hypothetical protein